MAARLIPEPVMASVSPGDVAMTIINSPQQENPSQSSEIERMCKDEPESEGQAKGTSVLHNFDRTKSWKIVRNSFDIERLYIPQNG
jgi:hypothetical protein